MKKQKFSTAILLLALSISLTVYAQETKEDITNIIYKVNDRWQRTHPDHKNAFWDYAAYHTGNMEAYFLTGKQQYLRYSENWAEFCEWKGAKSDNKSEWKYKNYGEGDEYVLFGDWQICFQTYIDLYNVKPEDEKRIARVMEVMEYQIQTPETDYLWWIDGLYMVMPVMTKLYKHTNNELYLEKLYDYWQYANNIMWDEDEKLYYRDKNFIYPAHKTPNGKKDFWSRGNGWAFAALAKVLHDLPDDHKHKEIYLKYFTGLADALIACQQRDGHWTRSLLDTRHAPGYETSGSAFFTYGLFWGINNGYLDSEKYTPHALRGWHYLSTIAMQSDGRIGYIQPIGASADPNQIVDASSSWNFGVGAFLLAACEYYRYLENTPSKNPDSKVSNYSSYVNYNKCSDSIHIKINKDLAEKEFYIRLIDLNGSVILSRKEENQNAIHFDLNGIAMQGAYILNITGNSTGYMENLKVLIN